MKKHKIFMGLILLTSVLISCVSNSKSTIGRLVAKHCEEKDTCIIVLTELTPFAWDSMLVFEINATRQEVLNSLPEGAPYSIDNINRIYFIKDGVVVHNEDEYPQWDEPLNHAVFFETIKNQRTWFPDDAIFKLKRIKTKGGFAFELIPIERQ
jgi:hypothetical protein